MENQNQTLKNEKKELEKKIASGIDGYVPLGQMKIEDIQKLDRVYFTLAVNKSKKGEIYYQLKVSFDVDNTDLFSKTFIINQIRYNLISYILTKIGIKADGPVDSFGGYIRIIKGKSTDDEREWYRYEIYVVKDITLTGFFTDEEVRWIKILVKENKLKLNTYESKAVIDRASAQDLFGYTED